MSKLTCYEQNGGEECCVDSLLCEDLYVVPKEGVDLARVEVFKSVRPWEEIQFADPEIDLEDSDEWEFHNSVSANEGGIYIWKVKGWDHLFEVIFYDSNGKVIEQTQFWIEDGCRCTNELV